MKIAFTGKRKINNSIDFLNSKDWKKISESIYNYLFDLMSLDTTKEYHFITGGALGTDLMCFGIIETIKSMHPQFKIKNELAIPHDNHFAKWSEDWKYKFNKCLEFADMITKVEYLDSYKSNNTYQKLQKRNEYMIDQSELIIAVWDSIEKGGTWNAIKYAKTKNKKIEYFYV